MADKPSWTKPLARMTYGDCIVGAARLEAGPGGGAGGGRGKRPGPAGLSALRYGSRADRRGTFRRPTAMSAQRRAGREPAGRPRAGRQSSAAGAHEVSQGSGAGGRMLSWHRTPC
jgi:hypothetical protein